MTWKRWLIVATLTAVLVSAGYGAAVVVAENRPGVTKANFDRIQSGVTTRDEVNELFAGQFERGFMPGGSFSRPEEIVCLYASDNGSAVLTFDGQDKLHTKVWHGRTIWDRLRKWARFDQAK